MFIAYVFFTRVNLPYPNDPNYRRQRILANQSQIRAGHDFAILEKKLLGGEHQTAPFPPQESGERGERDIESD